MSPDTLGYASAFPRWARMSMLAGIVFVLLVVAAVITAPALPNPGASTADYASSIADNSDGHITSTILSGFAALAFLMFLGGLFTIVHSTEPPTIRLSHLILGSGIFAIIMILIAQAVYAATAVVATVDGIEPGVVRGLDTLVYVMTLFGNIPSVAFLVAVAVAILQTGLAPRWIAWFGLLTAVINLIGIGGVYDIESLLGLIGLLSQVLFAVWTLLLSVALLRRLPVHRHISQPEPA